MAGKELTDKRFFGPICLKHPEFEGLRHLRDKRCVQCRSDDNIPRKAKKYINDPGFRDRERERTAKWQKNNPDIALARYWRYELAKAQRVPPWANHEKIKAIYQEAARTGMTVDHIVPLRGQLVSGLHVENNLQLLPGNVNFSKGNKFPIKDLE